VNVKASMMKHKFRLLLLFIVLSGSVVGYMILNRSVDSGLQPESVAATQTEQASPKVSQMPTPEISEDAIPEVDVRQPNDMPTAPEGPLSHETLATRNMVLAHAPLRNESVANPDSVENQRILQQMVGKAIASVPADSDKPSE